MKVILVILAYIGMMFLASILFKVMDNCSDNKDMTSGQQTSLASLWPFTLPAVLLFAIFILFSSLHEKIVNKITSMIQKD